MNTYLDGRREPVRRLSRFLVFALIVVLGVGTLTARLFYLQVANGTQYAALSTANRTVLEPIPAPRGLIYDRDGRLLRWPGHSMSLGPVYYNAHWAAPPDGLISLSTCASELRPPI